MARLLGLGYPGGPAIDKLARTGNAKAIRFPRGLTQPKYMGTAEEPGPHRYDWSFSGLKTAVARCVEQFEARGEAVPVADIAAAFQEAVVDVITSKAVLACRENGITELLLGGGVAANSRLRQLTEQRCTAAGIRLTVPPLSLCTDNGAMVAALGAQLVMSGIVPSGLGFAPDSSMPVTSVSAWRRPRNLGFGPLAHLLDQIQDDGAQVPAVLRGDAALPLVTGPALDNLLDVGQLRAAAELGSHGLEPGQRRCSVTSCSLPSASRMIIASRP